ncbi:MAG: hypothetical protein ACRET0_07555 [Steroidobacteraceae bacterium]
MTDGNNTILAMSIVNRLRKRAEKPKRSSPRNSQSARHQFPTNWYLPVNRRGNRVF